MCTIEGLTAGTQRDRSSQRVRLTGLGARSGEWTHIRDWQSYDGWHGPKQGRRAAT